MTRTAMTRLLLASVAAGGLLVALTPPAGATPGEVIHVHTAWGPYPCIQLSDPTGTHSACGGFADATYYASAGEWIGVDPIIGTNDWVSCTISNSSGVFFSDFGTLGDGHDINCYGTLVLSPNDSRMLT